jgi:hypothetical protein
LLATRRDPGGQSFGIRRRLARAYPHYASRAALNQKLKILRSLAYNMISVSYGRYIVNVQAWQ